MRCPICKGGHGRDSWSQESLDKHMASFHHMERVPEDQHAAYEEVNGTRWEFAEEAHKVEASEASARSSFVEAIDSMLSEVNQREASEVLATIPREEQEHAEAVEAVQRLSLQPMTLSSKLCWSWLATVLLIGVTLVALVLVTKV